MCGERLLIVAVCDHDDFDLQVAILRVWHTLKGSCSVERPIWRLEIVIVWKPVAPAWVVVIVHGGRVVR